MCISYFDVPQLFFFAAPEHWHSDAPEADAMDLGMPFPIGCFLEMTVRRRIVLPGSLALRRGRTCWTYLQFELNSPRCRLVDGNR